MARPFIIGIAGGSGSGKTTVANALLARLGSGALVLHADDYQRYLPSIPRIEGFKNWEHPGATDWEQFGRELGDLKRGLPIAHRTFDQDTLGNKRSTIIVPGEVVIVEGFLLLYRKDIRRLLDLKVFCDAADGVRVSRRALNNRSNEVLYTEKILIPMHHRYVEPSRQFADLLLNTGDASPEQCALIIVAAAWARWAGRLLRPGKEE